jgi:hypothetical protein
MAAGAMGLGASGPHRCRAAGAPHLAAGRVAMERVSLGMAAGALGLGADLTAAADQLPVGLNDQSSPAPAQL